MKYLFKIILLSSFLVSSLLSNTSVDERKSDLYYANGVIIDFKEDKAEEVWKKKVKKLFLNNKEEYNKLVNIRMSYNLSEDFLNDLFEAFQQSGNEQGWLTFSKYIPTYIGDAIPDSVDKHRPDLVTQINAYKESIKLGHSVIVVAHSQGNYYTNEAYEELDVWMKDYFHMMGVATPADHVAGGGPHITFNNDIINVIPTALPSNRIDPNTEHNSEISYDAHDFYNSYMTAQNTKTDIFNFILKQIQAHSNAPSQWETDEEKGTEKYLITVKHKFDSSITAMDGIDVYPFAVDKKLYPINPISEIDKQYVKASYGGTKILDEWLDKKDNEVYYLKGTNETVAVIVVLPLL